MNPDTTNLTRRTLFQLCGVSKFAIRETRLAHFKSPISLSQEDIMEIIGSRISSVYKRASRMILWNCPH